MQPFEKLGAFYLGRTYDPDARSIRDDLLLYDAKDLTTHAVCVGMTGSGKTGLCLSLLEEAAIDGIPAIAIDPKGDLGNLALTFPELRPADVRPWIDEGAVRRLTSTPRARPIFGARVWPTGDRTDRASRGFATRPSWRSTHPAAAPGDSSRSCDRSPLLRRPCSKTPTPCASE